MKYWLGCNKQCNVTGFELKFKKDLLSFKETHKLRVMVQKKRVQTNSNVLTSLDFKLKTDEWDKKTIFDNYRE